jgi:histidine ammonia-lyase
MGPIAARHARTVLEHVERIIAIELLVGAEALDQRLAMLAPATGSGEPAVRPGAGVAAARDRIRDVVPRLRGDREPGPDLDAVTRLVRDGRLSDLVRTESGRAVDER